MENFILSQNTSIDILSNYFSALRLAVKVRLENLCEWNIYFHFRPLFDSRYLPRLTELTIGRNSIYADIGINLKNLRISRNIGKIHVGDQGNYLQIQTLGQQGKDEIIGCLQVDNMEIGEKLTSLKWQDDVAKSLEIIGNETVTLDILPTGLHSSPIYWVYNLGLREKLKQLDVIVPIQKDFVEGTEIPIEIPADFSLNSKYKKDTRNLRKFSFKLSYEKNAVHFPITLWGSVESSSWYIDNLQMKARKKYILREGVIIHR